MAAEPEGSVTHWLANVKAGDAQAAEGAQRLFERYYGRLVHLAYAKLRSARTGQADEEDAAQSAFRSFCEGATAGKYPKLDDREALWRLLVTITARKASHLIRHETQLKRGGNRQFNEASLNRSDSEPEFGLDQALGREPTPEFAALVADEFRRLLAALGDETLQRIAVLKFEGYSNEEIAVRLKCAVRSIERKLRRIREILGPDA